MRILIITYWKETNPGTFLQAYGVQYALRQRFKNAEIKYLNYVGAIKETDSTKNEVKGAESTTDDLSIWQKIVHVLASKKRTKLFQQSQKKNMQWDERRFSMYLRSEEENVFTEYANSFNLIVIGSDTIIESCAINGKWGIMWPSTDIKTAKVYFAASADSAVNLLKHKELYREQRKRVSDFKQIGLRDYVTMNFFKDCLNIDIRQINKQPDPTFFLPISIFSISERKTKYIPKGTGRVIFYHFDRCFKYRKPLAKLLHEKGYFLVTSEYDPNCDLSLKSLTPFEWAGLFAHCDYVLTERFHDTVFAMRYKIPVLTVDWRLRIMNDKMESKRLSILKDFDCTENQSCL